MPDDLPRIPRHRGPINRPSEAAWLQQKLPAYRPLYTLRCCLPIVLGIGIICIVIAVLLYSSTNHVQEGIVDYTDCLVKNRTEPINFGSAGEGTVTSCTYNINLTRAFKDDVYFYYGLEGFYQNMRKYFQSRDDQQLSGKVQTVTNCEAFKYANKTPIAPCGAVARSMFNDSFTLWYLSGAEKTQVPFTTKDILAKAFRKRKYRNPAKCDVDERICPGFEKTAKPDTWAYPIAQLGYGQDNGRALENFDFIVWMETAALPKFRKIYRQLDRTEEAFRDGLPAGQYQLFIEYNFPVSEYGGRKKFVISTNAMFGVKSVFQCVAFFTLGIFFIFASIVMGLMEYTKLYEVIQQRFK